MAATRPCGALAAELRDASAVPGDTGKVVTDPARVHGAPGTAPVDDLADLFDEGVRR
ncbi:hypothetical protein OHS71_05335 [Streptomyces sp. NBC_00377]|uniref:hypothetical protein n=1 Tax=unclassified Streptomyces TaxID=2593676 RepID=UPI002E21E654|nr:MULTISPECIES: hypothetical protein [unclassified Streptomyces]